MFIMTTNSMENVFLNRHNVLFLLNENMDEELDYIKQNFCGNVFTDFVEMNLQNKEIYFIGDANSECYKKIVKFNPYVVREYSVNINEINSSNIISIGRVPINVHGCGVLFRKYFDDNVDYFTEINTSHQFQNLTESNKDGTAYRTGIYMTNVSQKDNDIHFNLLRCSSNLKGPTDNFRDIDNNIINQVNNTAKYYFKDNVNLNHVLAQVYHNQVLENKERKTKIKVHSDKTKDMNKNAIMAFCSFYKQYQNGVFGEEHMSNVNLDGFNYLHNKGSVLTTLRFRLKKCVNNPYLTKTFDVLLYPNSVFLMSLTTNRLYTHEIIPPSMPICHIPTRMGYVIRCSSTPAVFRDGNTYINGKQLVPGTENDIKNVKDLYYRENTTTDMVYYKDIYFSMNGGDYLQPIV